MCLRVRLLPGMLPDDLRDAARRLAAGMGVAAIRVGELVREHVDVSLLLSDPLAATTVPPAPVASVLDPLTLGTGEDGQPVTLGLAEAAHVILAGSTGSGKSTAAYSLLGQLVQAPDVEVAGSDVSGLVLGPWADRSDRLALGTGDPLRHVAVVEGLAADMDKRVAGLPTGRDSVAIGPDLPLILAVVEEVPGLYRWLDACDPKLSKRFRAGLARLLGEGRKAAIRCLLITQRADAAVIGGYERGQASHALSFRLDSLASVAMLHPDATAELAAEHSTAAPGVGLLSSPGAPLRRLRGPGTTYAAYCEAVVKR